MGAREKLVRGAAVSAGTLLLVLARPVEAHHWDWAYADQGHAMPIEGWDLSSAECQACVTETSNAPPESPAFQQCIGEQVSEAQGDPSKTWCKPQPLISPPPNPDVSSGACLPGDEITGEEQFEAECVPNFTEKMAAIADPQARHSKASCCLQYEIGPRQVALGETPWRGYQLTFGPYFMNTSVNDEFTIGYARVPNAANLDADTVSAGSPQTYEYMVAFEFWQYKGSHHFIMDDLLGPYNDPDQPRSCAPGSDCEKFGDLPESCPAETGSGGGPRTNPSAPGACEAPGGMRGFPTAGSPGPSYFPVPYPDGVGIKVSREHIFRMTHHLQHWFDPQKAQVWINVYTVPAKKRDGNGNLVTDAEGKPVESIDKEAHVFFDGSASAFLVPPHSISRTQGFWVAPRNIALYGLTFHSHKRNLVAIADLVGPDGNAKALPARTYPYSHPYCGGYQGCVGGDVTTCDTSRPPMHLYESTDWSEHEQCPYWREDVDENGRSDNDPEGAILIKQGEGIRYECWVNNGVLPFQALVGAGVMSHQDAEDQARLRPYSLAAQSVPLQPHDAFGKVVRGKFSCEEIPGVIPGLPGAGAVGYYGNRPCLPDVLKGKDPSTDLLTPAGAEAIAHGGKAAECSAEPSTWHQFCNPGQFCSPARFPFQGTYTGKCVPASIGFAETEDDEMCILLGLYTFTDDDAVPSPIDRLPTDVGR
ncbi:MAG: hypothetical protein ACREQ9_12320 [Candidatus Binatia bacterium]